MEQEQIKEVNVWITKMEGGYIAGGNNQQRIFTNLNKAIAWIKEQLQ